MFQRILVALDGTRLDEVPLARASALAREQGAELIVVHATTWPHGVAAGVGAAPGAFLRDLGTLDAATEDYLDLVAWRLRREGHTVRCRAVRVPAARAVCDAAREEGADVILMATHGRSSLARFLRPSVSEQVSREASCPVLVLDGRGGRRPGGRAPQPDLVT